MENFRVKFLIAGLGNPGKQYEKTRHNIGFTVVKDFAGQHDLAFKEETRFPGYVSKGNIGNQQVHLLLPATYMNESGKAVKKYIDYYQIPIQDLVIVYDDFAHAYGELRLKPSGSPGGHKGLESIEAALGTRNYLRMKMGIRGDRNQILSDYVLSPFTKQELTTLEDFIQRGVCVLNKLLTEPVEKVMNELNTRKPSNGDTNGSK